MTKQPRPGAQSSMSPDRTVPPGTLQPPHPHPESVRVPAARPAPGRPSLLEVQRGAGNRVALRVLAQAKLEVGAADDPYEREADVIADGVVARLSDGRSPATADDPPSIARRIQRLAAVAAPIGLEGGPVDTSTEQAIESARHGGAPLAPEARASMEKAFGADFSAVRVHAGSGSANLNRQLGAQAFTVGRDIFFRDRVPDSGTHDGRHLLAHELTHTVQQGAAAPRAVRPSAEEETA